MKALVDQECEACDRNATPLADDEIRVLLQQLPDWSITEPDGIARLVRDYSFADFAAALAFTNRVGRLAEHYNHHPEIVTTWGRVQVSWWTHTIQGLHKNDFILAAKTDALTS